MSFFAALSFPFRREHQIIFLFVTILNLIWIGAIIFAKLALQPNEDYMTSIPLSYGFTIFSLGYISYALKSRLQGQAVLPMPQPLREIKNGVFIGLALLLYNAPTLLLFRLWWNTAQAKLSFRPDAVVPLAGGSALFIASFGIFVFMIAYLAGTSFLLGLLRFSASDKLADLFDIRSNFSQITWKLVLSFRLFAGFFFLWMTNRFLITAFTFAFNRLVALLILWLGYDSPFAPLGIVCNYASVNLIDFATYLSFVWLLADYAYRLGVVSIKPVGERLREQ